MRQKFAKVYQLLVRDSMPSALYATGVRLSVRPSVRPSVTRVDQSKRLKLGL